MGSDSSRRIIANIFICLSIFVLPWWLSISLILISFFIFKPFYEGLLFGLLIDLLYFNPRELFYNLPAVFISLVVIFILVQLLGKQLRMRN
jgi:hypothetical protein